MWVKNVNNLRTTGSINSVLLSPINTLSVQLDNSTYVKQRLIQYIIHTHTVLFSTYKITESHLLFSIYPHNPQGLLLELLKRI
jgi:hypothetical protein